MEVTNQDLHCYVVGTFLLYDFDDDILQVTADGRTYTAISRIPGTLGWDMQVLLIVPKPKKFVQNQHDLCLIGS